MNRSTHLRLNVAVSILLAAGQFAITWGQEPAETPAPTPTANKPVKRVAVEEARRQAELLHVAMHSALQLVHHRYYREDEGLPIPAAIVEEVFADIESEQPVKLRWLVVEGQAMNTDHLAQDDFEHAAVEAIKADKPFHEEVSKGTFRRAAAITLSNHCLKCHVPDRKSTEDRSAGLIISIPVTSE
ncbi:MAG: DUF3365 domain-containing protein [Planctomycetaceae bacterium]|nr:DUF3365 domain-containing protein [Planctomycetaceae bacterium]